MPALALHPQLVQALAERSVHIVARQLQQHEILEATIVLFVAVFGVGGAIVYANKKL